MHPQPPAGIMTPMDFDVPTTLLVLAAAVLTLTLTVAFSMLGLRRMLKPLLQEPGPLLLPPVGELQTFELECSGLRCCKPLPDAAEDPQLVTATPTVSADDVAASARRKASRDRANPDTVTRNADSH